MASSFDSSEILRLDNLKIDAIVPAAGHGERMGFDLPKQYIEVCGKPLVEHCLQAFSKPPWIRKIVVVVDCEERFKEIVNLQHLPKVVSVQGKGESISRHHSILEGLKSLENDPPEIVVIHDGARPIVPMVTLSQVILQADTVGAAGVVRPLVSTVVRPDDSNKLAESLQRTSYRNSEMPQAFKYEMILKAYNNCSEEELIHGTECLSIAKKFGGVDAYLVEGTSDLWKITNPQDLEIAGLLLRRHCRRVSVLCLKCPGYCIDYNTSKSEFSKILSDEDLTLSIQRALQLLEERKINIQSNKDRNPEFLLCENTSNTLMDISSTILKNTLSATLITNIDDLQHESDYILLISCVKTFSEVETILTILKNNLKFKKYSILTIFNTIDIPSPEAEFLPLRQTILNTFADCNVTILSIICQREFNRSLSTQTDSKHNYTKKQLGLIIEQNLHSASLQSLHGQVLFL